MDTIKIKKPNYGYRQWRIENPDVFLDRQMIYQKKYIEANHTQINTRKRYWYKYHTQAQLLRDILL